MRVGIVEVASASPCRDTVRSTGYLSQGQLVNTDGARLCEYCRDDADLQHTSYIFITRAGVPWQMDTVTQTLEWFPEGSLHNMVHEELSGQACLKQRIFHADTPEDVMENVRLLFGQHFRGALTAQPMIRVLLAGSEEKEIQCMSQILRWLRGEQRARLSEYNTASNSLKLYLDFRVQAGGSSYDMLPTLDPRSHFLPHWRCTASAFILGSGVCDLTNVPCLVLCAGHQRRVCVCAGGEFSLDAILEAPLPDVRGSGSSTSVTRCDADREQHPTEVLQWPSFPADVRACLQWPELQVMAACLVTEQTMLACCPCLCRASWQVPSYSFKASMQASAKYILGICRSGEQGCTPVLPNMVHLAQASG